MDTFEKAKDALIAAIMALPSREEMETLSTEQLEQLRQYGNSIDNMLFLPIYRRQKAALAAVGGA